MKKIKLYIAISLNGKIARKDGSVDWLDSVPNPEASDYGYADFLKTIDTTIQGFNTYQQVINWGIEFPYKAFKNFVFTRKEREKEEFVEFISSKEIHKIKELKQQEGKDIWLIGGAQINKILLNEGLIDEIKLFIMPIIIPNGIELFEGELIEKQMKLTGSKTYPSGVVELNYELK